MNLTNFLIETSDPYRIKITLHNGKSGEIRLTKENLLKFLTNSDNLGGISNLIALTGLDYHSLITDLDYLNISDEEGNSFELRRTLSKKGEGLPFEVKIEAMHKKGGGKLNIVDVTDVENKFDDTRDSVINKELVRSVEAFKNLISERIPNAELLRQ